MNTQTRTLIEDDWRRIYRGLINYSASLEPDKSDAAREEREYCVALAADIYFNLP